MKEFITELGVVPSVLDPMVIYGSEICHLSLCLNIVYSQEIEKKLSILDTND